MTPSTQADRFTRILVIAVLVGATAWVALAMFPFDSDGALAVHDGVWYGMGAERDPVRWIMPHHPLFHAIAIGFVPMLRALGAEHPGHVAIRLVAGLGGIWLLLQVFALAGRMRPLAGVGFAAVILASRGFLVETAAGENVIPAAAAGLFALTLASRPAPRLLAVTAATTLAILLRIDNVLLVPGIAVALFTRLPRGARIGGIMRVGAASGLFALLGYAAAWMASTQGAVSFDRWLTPHGVHAWMGGPGSTAERFGLYATAIATATAGHSWPFGELHPWLGLMVPVVIIGAGVLLRGSTADFSLVAPVAVTLFGRALFHTWFEADNFEWLLMPLACVAALASGLARGEPATSPAARVGGALVLGALVIWMLGSHLPTTWRLRARDYMSAVEEAATPRHAGLRFVAQGETPSTALALLGVPWERIEETPIDPDSLSALVTAQLKAHPVETVLVLRDRFVFNGQPIAVRLRDQVRREVDLAPDTPLVRFVRRGGITCAVRLKP